MIALISVGTSCNNHCHFCHSREQSRIDDTELGVHNKVEKVARLGYDAVAFSGGEPTTRSELLKWVRHASLRGLRVGVVSNGRMLSYPAFLDRLVRAGLNFVQLSLQGSEASVHNTITEVDSFDETLGALKALTARGIDVSVQTVVSGRNCDDLVSLVDLVGDFSGVRLRLSMMVPQSAEQLAELRKAGGISAISARVEVAIQHALSSTPAVPIVHTGFPLCLLPGLEDHEDHEELLDGELLADFSEPVLGPQRISTREHGECCEECDLVTRCKGLHRGYSNAFGFGELEPVAKLRSNSFNYVFERSIEWGANTECPVFDRVNAFDSRRQLLIREGNEARLYRTTTRDFSDRELSEIKRRFGQIYLDVSAKFAPDDFASDLRKLDLVNECKSCSKLTDCMNCYEAVDENVFDRDDKKVQAILTGLRGRVLDIGCGDSRYKRELEELVAKGLVEYHGVEPDTHLAESFATSCDWAQLTVGKVEDLILEDDSYDHVLILRSYNHFAQPGEVIAKLSKALRPGGHLLIADNVAFGLVRTAEQAQRGEAGPAVFEHFRNHSGEDAREVVDFNWLSLESSLDINPETSNQWLLYFEKMAVEVNEGEVT